MCPVCASPHASEFFQKQQHTLLICRFCRHVWWDRFPPEGELTEYYSSQYTGAHAQDSIQSNARAYYAGHVRDLLQRIGAAAADARIADYGCSVPVLLDEARRAGFQYCLGVDHGKEALTCGAAWGIDIAAPAELQRVPDASLDIVRFSHILEHTTDPKSVLGTMLQKVRPGGLIYITQPSFPVFRPQPSARDLKDTVYPEHLHFFSPLSLLELVRGVNIEVRCFFTHQNEAAVLETYRDMLDLDYAAERLAACRRLGEPHIPKFGNYPYYAGENSSFYGTKPRRTG